MKKSISEPVENMVQSMRQIRDEISNEIKDMSFAEERDYLDKVLKSKRLASDAPGKEVLSAK